MTSATTYNMASVAPITEPHTFFSYVGHTPDKATVRELAVQLANHYFRCDFSRNQWSKEPKRICRWQVRNRNSDGTFTTTDRTSPLYQLSDIERHLSKNGTLKFDELGLPDPMCRWLDSSLMLAPGFHALANSADHALTLRAESNIGPRFPLVPTLDREGTAYTSFQTILLRRIGTLRSKLIDMSDKPAGDEWFQDFRTLVSECVALIENTIHQAYFKAQYDPLPGWKFDPSALGERYGRRVDDKIKWVYQITRKELHADAERKAFETIKELRNHLQHFDPPSFACTWEEMADWLNSILGVARLAWKLRACLSASLSVPLIELLLQRRVVFSPRDSTRRRLTQPKYVGYASTSAEALVSGNLPTISHETILMQAPPEVHIL